jgi:hypothetical protein
MWYEGIRCGGRLRRVREGIEWLAVIGVSTVPHELKCCRTATGMRTNSSGPPKNWKLNPVFGIRPPALDIDEPGTTG